MLVFKHPAWCSKCKKKMQTGDLLTLYSTKTGTVKVRHEECNTKTKVI